MGDPSQPSRFFMSPGFAPDTVRRTRTSPGPGSAAGNSPTRNTSAAGPWRSYHAAIIAPPIVEAYSAETSICSMEHSW